MVTHGRRSLWDRGDTSPPIFGPGGLNHECPSQYLRSTNVINRDFLRHSGILLYYIYVCLVLPSSTHERLFSLWSRKLMNSTMTPLTRFHVRHWPLVQRSDWTAAGVVAAADYVSYVTGCVVRTSNKGPWVVGSFPSGQAFIGAQACTARLQCSRRTKCVTSGKKCHY